MKKLCSSLAHRGNLDDPPEEDPDDLPDDIEPSWDDGGVDPEHPNWDEFDLDEDEDEPEPRDGDF
jgi:hypothetical protein